MPTAPIARRRLALQPEDGVIFVGSILFLAGTFFLPASQWVMLWSLPYVLFLPGWALVQALWPYERAGHAIASTRMRRAVLGFLANLIVVPGLSLGLSQTPIGLTEKSSAVILGSWALMMLFVSLLRRWVRPLVQPPLPRSPKQFPVAAFAVAAIVAISAGVIITVRSPPGQSDSYTELYFLDENGTGYGFPVAVAPGNVIHLSVGIASHEMGPSQFVLRVTDSIVNDSSSETLLTQQVSLSAGDTVLVPLNLTLSGRGDHRIDAELMNGSSSSEPYRGVRLWLRVA